MRLGWPRRREDAVTAAAAASPELERAKRQTRESAKQARADLAEQKRKLREGESLVAVLRQLHERNHVGADISRIIGRGYGNRGEAT